MPLPPWVPLDEPKPAPVPLLLVQAFVNTYEATTDIDLLREPAAAQSWLAAAGLVEPGTPLGPDDLQTAQQVREAIRRLLARNAGEQPLAASELAPLQAVARRCETRISVDDAGRVQLQRAAGTGSRIDWGGLFLAIRDSQVDGTWQQLKACENRECGWAFYDRSHGRRGRWCDMSICGNRVKNRNLRARRRSMPAPDATS